MKRSPGVDPPSEMLPTVWRLVKPHPDANAHVAFPSESTTALVPPVVTSLWKNQKPIFVLPLFARRSPPKKRTLWPAYGPAAVTLYCAAYACSMSSLSGDGPACFHAQVLMSASSVPPL